MIEKILAALAVLTCVLMLVRLALKPHVRVRLDVRLRAAAQRLRQRLSFLMKRPPRKAKPLPDDAAQAAEELIRRASQTGRVDRDGNVYRPEKFGKPPKKLH